MQDTKHPTKHPNSMILSNAFIAGNFCSSLGVLTRKIFAMVVFDTAPRAYSEFFHEELSVHCKRRQMARSLAAGCRSRMRGWCSTSKKPRVKKHRERFLTRLVHRPTGTTTILGPSITRFARQHDLCENEVWKLVNGHKIQYRGWTLQKSVDLVSEYLAEIAQ